MQSSGLDIIDITAPDQAFGLIQRLEKRWPTGITRTGNFTDNKNEKESA